MEPADLDRLVAAFELVQIVVLVTLVIGLALVVYGYLRGPRG